MKKTQFSQFDRLRRLFYVYLLKRGTTKAIWTDPGAVNIDRCKSSDIMSGYFLDFSKDADYKGPFDSCGVPMIDYTGAIGIQYNPWYIAHFALAQFEKYRYTGSSVYLNKFLALAENLKNKAVNKKGGKFYVWEYAFDWSQHLRAPWISSLSQAHGLSVMLRAFEITKKKEYLDLSDKVVESYFVLIDEGGILNTDGKRTIFEESPVRPVDTVLNGYIFSLWGILEYAQYADSVKVWRMYEDGLKSLKELLPEFDLPFWSLYSSGQDSYFPPIASSFYHQVHIAQMQALYLITSDPVFEYYAKRWGEYQSSFFKRNYSVLIKIMYKLFNY